MAKEQIGNAEMLIKIAAEEKFQVEQLPQEYAGYYISVENQSATERLKAIRCVDDRPVIEAEAEEALGPQIPGSSYGLVDALKFLTHVSEEDAITQIQIVLKELGYAFSTHEHCGYLGLAEKEDNPLQISETLEAHQRFTRVDAIPGVSLHLKGEHAHGALAIINLDFSTRFNSAEAVSAQQPAFNFDYHFAQQVEDTLVNSGQNNLAGQFANQVTRLYLKTIKELTHANTVYFHKPRQQS